ncbi:MAG: DNA repair protein RecN [Thermoanaerobaculia bacterium]|jgi:DNA repair protein RecN (Recombination protein N)
MLTYLKVRNLAIVEEFEIEPGPGFNVLTGETGAGKSLLIDSLEFLSGARGSTESIRSGADKMSAEAIFHLPSRAASTFEEYGVEVEVANGAGDIVVRRELASTGRGRVSINGAILAVRELERGMDPILEIHGQEASHDRIAGQGFRELVDAYAGLDTTRSRAREAHAAWKESAAELSRLRGAEQDRALKLDLLRYQIDEISAAKLEASEEDDLRGERAMLANAQQLTEATSAAFAALDEDEDSALARIARAEQSLEPLGRGIEDVRRIAAELADIRYRLQESARDIGHFGSTIRHDPARLDIIEERLATIERLKRKYGATVAEVLAHFEAIKVEHDQLADFEAATGRLAAEEEKRFAAWRSIGAELSKARAKAASRFEKEIEQELRDLAMERTSIRVALGVHESSDSRLQVDGRGIGFGADGWDVVDVLIAPNRGEELRPMSKIASGGELSRIQLAIAAALFKHADTTDATLVFDEVDQGVGGRVAEVVGRKLRELARTNQVICVTHLPQIAGLGETHFRVWKEESAGRTVARIARLDTREERVDEIARMLAGVEVSASARAHAAELLSASDAESGRKSARGARAGR